MMLQQLEMVYYQESDDCDSSTLGQELFVSVDNAGAGPYVILKTERWAVGGPDDIDALAAELKRVLAMVENEPGIAKTPAPMTLPENIGRGGGSGEPRDW